MILYKRIYISGLWAFTGPTRKVVMNIIIIIIKCSSYRIMVDIWSSNKTMFAGLAVTMLVVSSKPVVLGRL